MSPSADQLMLRREALVRRAAGQRWELHDHFRVITGAVDGVDRGLGLVRRFARPSVLLGASVIATLVLGRGRVRQFIGAGLAVTGLLVRLGWSSGLLGRLVPGLQPADQPGADQPGVHR